MKRFMAAIVTIVRGLSRAVSRFPLTVLCLIGAASLVCYTISLHTDPDLIILKLMVTFLLGAFLGVAAQFACERLEHLSRMRIAVYVVSVILTAGYYLIIMPAPNISFELMIRTFVAVFAMFCVFIWLPSYRGTFNFNVIALIHLKSAFTSILYSGVLAAGCAAIIAAIDILLFNVNPDTYAYTMAIIWILFAPIYYLSLLPRFNSNDEFDCDYTERVSEYPKFLEILVSYIAIPLVTAYTLVLAAYFVKILVTLKWPSGQLGALVLAYSAAGLIIYILASVLENRAATLYRKIFPKVLIPVVIMQLISVGIRLNAYGFTESRYYVALFGIFSLTCGILLSFKPVYKNGIIAILAACFAIFSVIPPVDAFTVSRVSQINRLENILKAEGILSDGKITSKADVPMEVRTETTSILSYLDNRGYTKYVTWLPSGFRPYDQMQTELGFEPAYDGPEAGIANYYAGLDMQKPINISGYDITLNAASYMKMDSQPSYDFEVRGVKYNITLERQSPQECRVLVKDAQGNEVVGTGLYDFAKSLTAAGNQPKNLLEPEKASLNVQNNGYKLRILFQELNMVAGPDNGVNYTLIILFGVPAK